MSIARWTELYLDYVNNFLTIDAFAAHHSIELETAVEIVRVGRIMNLIPQV